MFVINLLFGVLQNICSYAVGRSAVADRWGQFPARPPFLLMHLLYLDDSGSVQNASDSHIILAGVAVFERQPHWLSERLDRLAETIWPDNPQGLEFRGVDMLSGRRHSRGVPRELRASAYSDALQTLGQSEKVRLFGAAIHKATISPEDPMEYAFEQVCNRFDRFLGRLHKQNNTQRGLIILDESSYETSLQGLAKNFRTTGHKWGRLYNLADVPFFVDSKATRMIQYADMVAHAVRRYYEKGEAQHFDLIAPRFDSEGGVTHGLTHFTPQNSGCNCYVCRQRKTI